MNKDFFLNKSNKKNIFIILVLALLFFVLCSSAQSQTLKYGSLSVESYPRGAKVYLDNNYKGTTPLNLKNIAIGQYTLKLVLEGYQDWTSTVVILPILTVTISADLVPEKDEGFGSISVNSNPQGADIYIDGAFAGITPINIQNFSSGRYRIRVTLPGYEDWFDEIFVTSRKTERVNAELVPRPNYGSLSLYCDQNDAKVFLNGVYKTDIFDTPTVIEDLDSGNYEIVVIKEGFRAWVGDITVNVNEETSLDVIMTEIFG